MKNIATKEANTISGGGMTPTALPLIAGSGTAAICSYALTSGKLSTEGPGTAISPYAGNCPNVAAAAADTALDCNTLTTSVDTATTTWLTTAVKTILNTYQGVDNTCAVVMIIP